MNKLKNGTIYLDTDGNPVHAHGGYIIFYQGYFYWYGEDRRENYYVSCYRSKNLKDWEFRNHILTTASETQECRIRTVRQLVREDGGKVNLERPKVLYNEKTGKFVLWAHYENGKDYCDAAAAIATCDTPDGDRYFESSYVIYPLELEDGRLVMRYVDEIDPEEYLGLKEK